MEHVASVEIASVVLSLQSFMPTIMTVTDRKYLCLVYTVNGSLGFYMSSRLFCASNIFRVTRFDSGGC